MAGTAIAGVVGTDGVAPIYDAEGRFQIWELSEVYLGADGTGKYIPKVGDMIIDMSQGALEYKVTSLDLGTGICTYVEITTVDSETVSDDDKLLGVGPGTTADTYRMYINKTTTPYEVALDQRLYVRGSACKYCRVFRGADLNISTGTIISTIYNTSGTIADNKVELELADTGSGTTNYTVKTVPNFYTTQDIPDAEVVTAVFYSESGVVVSKRQLLVENTAFIKAANLAVKYVTGISLECPFLSTSDATKINLPINVILSGVNLVGVVHYSDGTSIKLPVDGTKFTMYGLSGYLGTQSGQTTPLVLKYLLSSNEYAYSASSTESQYFFSKSYTIVTATQDGAYSVKLYGYPVWVDATNGYTLRWFLYNLDRSVVYDVTGYVTLASTSPAWKPTTYGLAQELIAMVNLQAVNGSYKDYDHSQTIGITLKEVGTMRTTNWTIEFDAGQDPQYGNNVYASYSVVNANYHKLNISMGLTSLETWLQAAYYNTRPMFDTSSETEALYPTHFILTVGGIEYTYELVEWANDFVLPSALVNNGTLFVKFIKRTTDTDLQLSVAGMPVYQV